MRLVLDTPASREGGTVSKAVRHVAFVGVIALCVFWQHSALRRSRFPPPRLVGEVDHPQNG